MAILVLCDHDGASLAAATLNAVAAAAEIGGDIDLLVAGSGTDAIASEAAKISGVARVLHADAAEYANGLAENVAPLIVGMADSYSHILAPATTYGKNIMPRVAALKDVAQISDIIKVVDADTFQRPIYAGNALATVSSSESLKIVTVRATAFEAAGTDGSASVEAVQQLVMQVYLHLKSLSSLHLSVQNLHLLVSSFQVVAVCRMGLTSLC
jgi:electron transfer flavoprotein alpha subunit